MTKEQQDRIASLVAERQPVYRVTALSDDGTVEEELLFNDYTEARSYNDNWEDVVGATVIFEVIQ
jgi:hypothetical protein